MRNLFFLTLFMTWTSAPLAAELPCGQALNFGGGDTAQIVLSRLEQRIFPGDAIIIDDERFAQVTVNRRGFVTLRAGLVLGDDDHPTALHALGNRPRIIAPFWLDAAACDAPDPTLPESVPGQSASCRAFNARGSVEYTVDESGLHIVWYGLVPFCEDAAPRASFALTIAPPDADGQLQLTFRYHALEWSATEPARSARAGVRFGGADTSYELFVDEGQRDGARWSGAGKYAEQLLNTGNEVRIVDGEPEDEPDPGVWVITVGPDGRVVGDGDGDGLRDGSDNCRHQFNPLQEDLDRDTEGDACDDDDDGDTVLDDDDNCPLIDNEDQADLDLDRRGDVCDWDDDGDRVPDIQDNCILQVNPAQLDLDEDGQGDACDMDIDGDGLYPDVGIEGLPIDICPYAFDDGRDSDRDGLGDACDLEPRRRVKGFAALQRDADGDGVSDLRDGCPHTPNPDQLDRDWDGTDDACDADANGNGIVDAVEWIYPLDLGFERRRVPGDLGALILLDGD